MTTATDSAAPVGWDHDFGSARPVSMVRLVRVELRKMLDTRAGLWLVAAILGITALALLLVFLNTDPDQRTFFTFSAVMAIPQSLLLPILGILLVTQEWGQRTGMVTFALTPSRGKVIAAKIAAALMLGLAAFVICNVLASLFTLVGGASDPWVGVGADDIAKFLLLELVSVAQGLAFGLVFLNSPVAIVTYLVAPQVLTLVGAFWSRLGDIQPWIDLNESSRPLFSSIDVSGEQWGQLATSVGVWVLLPFVLGLVRVLRAELK